MSQGLIPGQTSVDVPITVTPLLLGDMTERIQFTLAGLQDTFIVSFITLV